MRINHEALNSAWEEAAMEEQDRIAFVGVDIETTGLAKDSDVLEVAVLCADSQFQALALYTILVDPPGFDVENMEPEARKMHSESGLLVDLSISRTGNGRGDLYVTSYERLDRLLCDILSDELGRRGQGGEKFPMLGSSVHFDRGFLERVAPEFTGSHFTYRNIDASSFSETLKVVDPKAYAHMRGIIDETADECGMTRHRAAVDIQLSAGIVFACIEEFRGFSNAGLA